MKFGARYREDKNDQCINRIFLVCSELRPPDWGCTNIDAPLSTTPAKNSLRAALPFLRAGLERRERCLYIADENTTAAVLNALREAGTDVDLTTFRAGP